MLQQPSTDLAPINTLGSLGFAQMALTYPFIEVTKSLEKYDRQSFRLRNTLNEFIVYLPIMMALENVSIEKAFDSIQKGSTMIWGSRSVGEIGSGGLANARLRVGFEPLEDIFLRMCRPLADEVHTFTHIAGLRMVAIDGTLANVADTAKNAEFGRPKNQHQKLAGYPQARMVALIEIGTHAIFGLKIANSKVGEETLAKELLETLESDMLVMADRLYLGWELVNIVLRKNAQLLWRFQTGHLDRFEIQGRFSDGSYKAKYVPPAAYAECEPIDVRIVAYMPSQSADSASENREPTYLVTTILDPESVSAEKLILTYMQRWEIEMVFKEMKVVISNNEPLSAQRPELVKQQIYGIALAHYIVRKTIYLAARTANLDPDVISFKGTLETIKTNCKLFSFSDSLRKQLDSELRHTLGEQIEVTMTRMEAALKAANRRNTHLQQRCFIDEVIKTIRGDLEHLANAALRMVAEIFTEQPLKILKGIIQEVATKRRNRVSSSRGKSSPRNTKRRTNPGFPVRKQPNPPKLKYVLTPQILGLGDHAQLS